MMKILFCDSIYESLFTDDRVTGNGSGSYTFDRELAKQYLNTDEQLTDDLQEVIDSNMASVQEIGEAYINGKYEDIDVLIRCSKLYEAVANVISKYDKNKLENYIKKYYKN